MTDKLKVYKDTEVVGSADRGQDGKATVKINDLEANKDYEAGIYQVVFENENGESPKVDVPAFKTKGISVTGLTLDKTESKIEVGGTSIIKATVAPDNATDKTVTFNTANDKIATVDKDGKITGVAVGETEITATTNDGNKVAKVKVSVTEKSAQPDAPSDVNVETNSNDAEITAK